MHKFVSMLCKCENFSFIMTGNLKYVWLDCYTKPLWKFKDFQLSAVLFVFDKKNIDNNRTAAGAVFAVTHFPNLDSDISVLYKKHPCPSGFRVQFTLIYFLHRANVATPTPKYFLIKTNKKRQITNCRSILLNFLLKHCKCYLNSSNFFFVKNV